MFVLECVFGNYFEKDFLIFQTSWGDRFFLDAAAVDTETNDD